MRTAPSRPCLTRRSALVALGGSLLSTTPWALAHGFRVGALVIDHPFATPSVPGTAHGVAYFRGIRNRGSEADRLLSAHTPVAQRVELHHMAMDGDIMRMRAVTAIDLPAGKTVALRPGQGYHLMLVELHTPLVEGERFDLTLRFERAGEITVKVWVQRPRNQPVAHSHQH